MKFFVLFLLVSIQNYSYASNSELSLFGLEDKNIAAKNKDAITRFLKETEDRVPPVIKEALKEKIIINFVDFEQNKGIIALSKNKCEKPENVLLGQVNQLKPNIINISQLFLPEILKGEENAIQFNCGHKNYYRQAMATILHELSHIYDHKKIRAKDYLGKLNACSGNATLGEDCRGLINESDKNTVTGLNSFYKLSNWKTKYLFFNKAKNLSSKRSPDAYEYKNLEEHFAVNFEFFIMDPEYKCKRPSYYHYYANHFEYVPFSDINCSINSKIILDDKRSVVDISPERVYRVDYLLASGGDQLISGFGHAMYRLVVCAPFRTKVDENCLKDKLYHVVLSYRANVSDIKTNTIKGLIGGYDSILYMLSFPNVVEEYNMGELRDLYSLPIHFSKAEKEQFLYKVLENYWEYVGDYKFISNNCASESNELLQSALNEHPVSYGSIVKPYSLMTKIIDSKLSDKNYFKDLDKARKDGIFFSSDTELLTSIANELLSIGKTSKSKEIKKSLESVSAEQIGDSYKTILDMGVNNEAKSKLSRLSILAQATLTVKQHLIDEKVGSFLEDREKEQSEIGNLIREWNSKRKDSRLKSIDNNYGIPLTLSDEDFERHESEIKEVTDIERKIVTMVKEYYADDIKELLDIKRLIDEIRDSNKIISMKLYLNK